MQYLILLVDDSNSSRSLLKDTISKNFNNVQFIEAENGKIALEKAFTFFPDIIIMDNEMPVLDGISAIKALKSNPKTLDTPVIMVTSTNSYKTSFEAGATDFIKKPFNDIMIYSRIRSAMNVVASYRELKAQKIRLLKEQNTVREQQAIISKNNEEFIADLRYSRRIQEAVLPDKKILDKFISQYFILNIPKNIVSGDFYWLTKNDDILIIAVGDSTGHGVSGALLHMMGSVFLSEIVRSQHSFEPNYILDELRSYVMKFLRQTGEKGETQDGMDISLCVIDYKNMKLKFSGANNPIYIISKSRLYELKGDRMPVGIHINYNKPFSSKEFDIEDNDMIYLFTDGYADQFGGEKGKKFRYKKFKNILGEIYEKSMAEQKDILHKLHLDWKGNLEQLDDILIVGFRIKK